MRMEDKQIDGWDFKQYVLGTLFYRFISEKLIKYMTQRQVLVRCFYRRKNCMFSWYLLLWWCRAKNQKVFVDKQDIEYVCKMEDFENVVEESYNLSVSSYVEAKGTREVIDIAVLNADIKQTVAKINVLRDEIDKIVAEIEQ